MNRPGLPESLAVRAVGYLALLAAVAWPLVREPATLIPLGGPLHDWLPGDGDPWNFLWRVDWLWRNPASFLDPLPRTHAIFHPFGADLVMLRGMLLQGVLALGLKPLGDVVLAHNVIWALSFLLSALATAALAEEVSGSRPGAFVAGAFLAFGPHFYVHSLQHSYKYVAFAVVPIALLALLRFLDGGRLAALAAFGAAAAGLLLSDWYNVLYLSVAGGLLVLLRAVALPWRTLHRRLGMLAMLVLPLGALGLWSLAPVLSAQAPTLVAGLDEQARFSVDLVNLALPPSFHAFWGDVSASRLAGLPGNEFEKTAFMGWILPIVVAALVWRDRGDTRIPPWLIVGAVFLVLALGPWLQWEGRRVLRLPGYWLGQVPGFAASRAPARYLIMVQLAFAIVLALVVSRRKRPRLVSAVLLVLMAVEFAPFATPVARWRVRPSLAALAGGADGALIDVPYRTHSGFYTALQIQHRRPLVGGYAIRATQREAGYPRDVRDFDFFRDPLGAPLPREPLRLHAALSSLLGVRWIAIHRAQSVDAEAAAARILAAGLGAEPWASDADTVLLRLPDSSLPPQPMVHPGEAAFSSQVLTLGWSSSSPGQIWGEEMPQLALHPAPSARAVALELLPYWGTVTRQAHRLTVFDGHAQLDWTLKPGWQEVVVPLRSHHVPWVLSMRIDRTGRPADLESASEDRRNLSVALRTVRWVE